MTEPTTEWATHSPPWLAKLHPDLVEDEQPAGQGERERTPEERAADLIAQLERAAAGRVPPALAGAGWGDAPIAEYSDEPAQPVLRARVPGPWPCQLDERHPCPHCDRTFVGRDANRHLSVHLANSHPPVDEGQAPDEPKRRGKGATKPQPGARKKTAKKRKRKH